MDDRGNGETKSGEQPGATASFPYDRVTVEHFRENFPRARWSDEKKAWFIPGKTANRRFEKWREREFSATSAYADMRGRDAYAFDPVHSKYLSAQGEQLEVRTPFSRTVVEQMRLVPFAAWDGDQQVWTVPFRSYEELRRRWPQIEAAARRNEPEARRERQAQRRGSAAEHAARARSAERRRRRHPLRPDQLPPLGRPVMTSHHGLVVFNGSDGEVVEPDTLATFYAGLPSGSDYVWGTWRAPTLDELIKTWPSRSQFRAPDALWWQPTLEELRVTRKAAAARERRNRRAEEGSHDAQ